MVSRRQCIFIHIGYSLPLTIRDRLAYFDMHKPTDTEYQLLLHVIITLDADWDPKVLDHQYDLEDDNVWYDTLDPTDNE